VLEIGPGTGNLTVKLLESAKRVIAVEIDPRMAAELQKRVSSSYERAHAHTRTCASRDRAHGCKHALNDERPFAGRLQLMMGDFMKVDLPYFDVCVANTPYQISSPLVFKLLAHRPMFRSHARTHAHARTRTRTRTDSIFTDLRRCAVLMFQREFALRLIAQPGSEMYCRLSVNTQLLSKVSHIIKVSRNSFRPPPKVDSSVVRMKPKKNPLPINFVEWDGLIKACFSRKNKTLGAIFRNKTTLKHLEQNYHSALALHNQKADDALDFKALVLDVLQQSGFSERRAAKLEIDDFMTLLKMLNDHHVYFALESATWNANANANPIAFDPNMDVDEPQQ
jgi:18S rRNA (adenine1779-N6/adenine1780-N6)-dimethyltransferase